jgi:phospholipid/cholesterol/gamma-HCH transport system permease protein
VKEYFQLLGSALFWIVAGPFQKKPIKFDAVAHQMVMIGVRSLPMTSVLCFFMGLVLAMQSAYTLSKFGAQVYVTHLISVSFFREIGPLLTGITLAGRCGSAMAAELGTMKTSEEIEALEVMAISPVRFLVSPRCLAALLMMPALTIIGEMAGNLGGWIIGVMSLGISSSQYVSMALDAIELKDVGTGLLKAMVYAALVSSIACHWGMTVTGGAEGVGRATTQSVVTSLFAILLADVVLTALFYFL